MPIGGLIRTIITLYLIMLMGVGMVKTAVFSRQDSVLISKLVLYVVMPCLIISAYCNNSAEHVQKGLLLAFIAAIAVHILFLVISALLRKFNFNGLERACIIYSNSGNFVIPIIYIMFGSEYVVYCTAFISVQNLLIWSHGKSLILGERTFDWKKAFCNINIFSTVIGMAIFFSGIKLLPEINNSLDMVAKCVAPLTMVITGMLLADLKIESFQKYPKIFPVVVFRLLIVPLLTLLVLRFFPVTLGLENSGKILLISLFSAMAPPANTVMMMAQIYGKDAFYVNVVSVVSTILCVFSMPLMVWIYQTL